MKKIIMIIVILIMPFIGVAQDALLDSIKHSLSVASNDTSLVIALNEYSSYYKFNRPDSTMFYGAKALTLARQIKFPKGEIRAMGDMALTQLSLGNQAKALQIVLVAIKIAEKNHLILEKAQQLHLQGLIYKEFKNYEKALNLFVESKNVFDSIHNISFFALAQSNIGDTFLKLNQPDSALYYCQLSYDNLLKENWVDYRSTFFLGKVHEKIGNTYLALALLKQSLSKALDADNFYTSSMAIAQLYQQLEMPDSSIFYAKKSLEIAQNSGFLKNIIEANLMLSNIYEIKDIQQAFQYNKKAITYKDSLSNLARNASQESIIDFDQQERQREIEDARSDFQNRLRMNAFLGITFTLLVIAIFLIWNNRLKQKAKRNIEKAYNQLKAAQSQLIQAEKMASLGELTAGIAHEIQNPLNFVNNFSEVNTELIDELNAEADKGNLEEIKAIAKDIKENEQKINHHGKRADAIVKGMLQHSRTSSGVKEPTDINALAEEYLRLAYHGLRAKDKSFNADFIPIAIGTDFDPTLPKINVVPQDIGRVLLNLINNAFYAVHVETQNSASLQKPSQKQPDYNPTVIVSTKNMGTYVEIRVKDNGPGIPAHIVDKIFQPFFTTKPTGEGTGLGLSLSYDIVKAHGGELNVETKEGEGSEFIIGIPFSNNTN